MISLGQKVIACTTLLAMNTMFVYFFGLLSIIPLGFSILAVGYIFRL